MKGLAALIGMCCLLADARAQPPVSHLPIQPRSGEAVTVTAALPASNATLQVQVVEPGQYWRKTDAAYSNNWQAFSMTADARGAFSLTLPATLQVHRRLVRYFVEGTGTNGARFRIPAATNDCPNFAYFVYYGIPEWKGASDPGHTPALTFPAGFMKTLPAYHLIARRTDVEQSQWNGEANRRRFHGTFVYEGHVYDHMQFQNRGKASTYVSGKNKWGFKFNEADPFHDRDLWGRPINGPLKSVSLTSCASPWAQVNRGMAGMDEAVSFRAYQLAGVPAADTHWIQLRVIAGREEAPDQYHGDLWGLYQVVQEPGAEFLRSHALGDGEVYSPETGIKHRPKGAPTNDVAFQRFMSGPHGASPAQWWQTNLDLPRYYTFHALNRVLSNVDVRPGANYYAWHEPDGRWCIIPWDLDMMFIAKTHQPGVVEATRCLDVPELRQEYRNRAREVLDLFCSDASTNGGQIGQLVDELAAFLRPNGFERNWAELDLCVWNHHPRSNAQGQFYLSPYRDSRFGGEWTRTLSSRDFAGFCKYIVDFCTDTLPGPYEINSGDQRGYGFGYLSIEATDDRIPATPKVESGPGALKFTASPFRPAAQATFAAVQWRVAEISAPGLPGYHPGEPRKYELQEFWRSQELPEDKANFDAAAAKCQPNRTYRVRARYKDSTGRWSHWSTPVQFVGQ